MERSNLVNIILISLATFLAGLSLSILSPFYPTEALNKGVTVSQTGIVLSSVFITTILITPICGKYIQILGARNFLIIGSLIGGVGNILFGFLLFVDSHTLFLTLSILIRVLTAIGEACVAPASYTLAGQQVSEDNRGKAIAVAETSFGVGTMFGPTVGGVLYDYGGFLLPFVVTGLMMVTVAVLGMLLLKESRFNTETDGDERNVSWWDIISSPGVAISVFGLMFAGCGWSWYLASLEPFLKHKYHVSSSQTGLVFMVFGLSYTLFSPVVGYLTDKGLNGLHAMIVGNFIIFLGYVFLGPIPPLSSIGSLTITTVALGCQGLGSSFTYIGTLLFMMKGVMDAGLPDKEQTRGMVSSLWVIADCTGGYIGASLGSLAYDKVGFQTGTVIVGGLLMSTVVIMTGYGLLLRNMARNQPDTRLDTERQQLLISKEDSINNNSYGTNT